MKRKRKRERGKEGKKKNLKKMGNPPGGCAIKERPASAGVEFELQWL